MGLRISVNRQLAVRMVSCLNSKHSCLSKNSETPFIFLSPCFLGGLNLDGREDKMCFGEFLCKMDLPTLHMLPYLIISHISKSLVKIVFIIFLKDP